jgi:hypothetical protein
MSKVRWEKEGGVRREEIGLDDNNTTLAIQPESRV